MLNRPPYEGALMGIFMVKDPATWSFVAIVLGLLFCFMGRKILPIIVILLGFAIGYSWGAPPLADLMNSNATWIPWLAGGIAAILSVVLWKVSVFFAGTIIGLFVMRDLFPELAQLVHVVAALAFGALVQLFRKPVISLFTALAGAYMTGTGLAFLAVDFGLISTVGLVAEGTGNLPRIIQIGVTVILTIVGYLFQTKKLED